MKNILYIINSAFFVIVMIVGGILFWVLPKQTVSNDENRNLAVMPIANQQTLISGEFEKKFEEYYNDHFVMRDNWIAFATQLNSLKGVQNQEFKVITPVAPPPQAAEKPTAEPNENSSAGTSSTASAAAQADATEPSFDPTIADDYSKIKGVVVVNGRVVQNFGGSKHTLKPFADMLNEYRKSIPNKVNMYAMIIPSGSDFYLPQQITKGEYKEKENVEIFKTLLDAGIKPVPAYDNIAKHTKEYIMFRTDHHWTGLGAYYAYQAFAETAGFKPLRLDQMTHVSKEGTFMGSLYNYTRDQSLKDNPDTLDYYKVPNEYTVTLYNKDATNTSKGVLYAESAKGYSVFLGGDFPLLHIKTNVNNGRKILIVKDSFGNALSTYMAANYGDVYVIDYRHFKGNIPKFIAKNDIQDFLYAHNSFAANSPAAVKYGKAMLH